MNMRQTQMLTQFSTHRGDFLFRHEIPIEHRSHCQRATQRLLDAPRGTYDSFPRSEPAGFDGRKRRSCSDFSIAEPMRKAPNNLEVIESLDKDDAACPRQLGES